MHGDREGERTHVKRSALSWRDTACRTRLALEGCTYTVSSASAFRRASIAGGGCRRAELRGRGDTTGREDAACLDPLGVGALEEGGYGGYRPARGKARAAAKELSVGKLGRP